MPTPTAFGRVAVTLLPFIVAAGCIQGATIGYDDRPPISDDSLLALTPEDEIASATSVAGAAPRPAEADVVAPADAAPADGTASADAAPADGVTPAAATPAGPADGSPDPAGATGATPRPAWLGTIPLPPAPSDGSALPTPPELVDRRLPPPSGGLPAPATEGYAATIGPIPSDVLARSTWKPECPVGPDELRYLTLSHWGFDGRVHTGELIVHASAAEATAKAFERLHELRFPIEELRVVSMADMTALSTGDGNVSSGFVCRKKVSGRSWSEHSYGLALDINPFHNPYLAGTLVVPGLAGSYLDRSDVRPGMIVAGDEVVQAFAVMGWRWGGDWNEQKDWMHFSASGK